MDRGPQHCFLLYLVANVIFLVEGEIAERKTAVEWRAQINVCTMISADYKLLDDAEENTDYSTLKFYIHFKVLQFTPTVDILM